MQVIHTGSEVCVAWNFSADEYRGNWSTKGCKKVAITNGIVTCHCNHLTNFAVLIVSGWVESLFTFQK